MRIIQANEEKKTVKTMQQKHIGSEEEIQSWRNIYEKNIKI